MNTGKVPDSIRTTNLIGIKAGLTRTDFLEIWMVVVHDRIFARSWGLAEKSWYNCFLENPQGQISCDGNIYDIEAIIPSDIHDLTDEINDAYLTKYNSDHNIRYSKAIIRKEHISRTMEIIIKDL
ncbi:DUF2255 family protein [Chryseobacterium sp.]|uniref:DUF2255 family protein n=1 Tax=Chryseobacterium sp. TaxID=1871047 RepID=UPI0025BA8331|nr:DUF2255 family protein [Chryseobacterium sp.]MBV8326793.1 DUF2255 family protein [Chryseobacterium sp.]